MVRDERENGSRSLVDITVETEATPPLRIRIRTIEPDRMVELRAGDVSLFVHSMQLDTTESYETNGLH